MNALSPPPLALLVRELDAAAAATPEDRPGMAAAALAARAADPTLLLGHPCPSSADRYCRHLLHADPGGAYALVALVWRPGQMSPVHAHRAWCALAVHRGAVTETFYRADAGGEPEPVSSRLLRPGGISQGLADPEQIHRLANLGCGEAVTLHAYGVAFERFSTGLNLVYAA